MSEPHAVSEPAKLSWYDLYRRFSGVECAVRIALPDIERMLTSVQAVDASIRASTNRSAFPEETLGQYAKAVNLLREVVIQSFAWNGQFDGVTIFRRKPTTTPAVRWTGDNLDEVRRVRGPLFPPAEVDIETDVFGAAVLMVRTPSGKAPAAVGDWILVDSSGFLYPCESRVFERTYEPVETPAGEP